MPRDRAPRSRCEIAVLIPCYNEAQTIAKVVARLPRGAARARPSMSTTTTRPTARREAARAPGAVVRREPRQGKGNVVRRMFADIEADIYVMVDGDATYDAAAAPRLVDGSSTSGSTWSTARACRDRPRRLPAGPRLRQPAATGLVRRLFGERLTRHAVGLPRLLAPLREFLPGVSTGFEIETELTIHALSCACRRPRWRPHTRTRPEGSESKLTHLPRRLPHPATIMRLVKQERPLEFFSAASRRCSRSSRWSSPAGRRRISRDRAGAAAADGGARHEHDAARLPRFACGLILDTVTRGRQEAKRMRYLAVPGILATVAGRAPRGRPAASRRALDRVAS